MGEYQEFQTPMGRETPSEPETKTVAAAEIAQPVSVGSSAWLDALGWHVANMKAREQEHRRKSDDERTKFETVMHERMLLENEIDKLKSKRI